MLLIALFVTLVLTAHAPIVRADESAGAFHIPAFSGVAQPIWLTAADFTPGELVSISLSVPDGQTCTAVDIQSGQSTFTVDDLSVAQAIIDPSVCSTASGQWTATFNGNTGRVASAGFSITAPNRILSVPYSP